MAQALKFDDIKESCTNLTNLASSIGSTVEAIEAAIAKIANPAWEGKAAEAYRDKITKLAANLPEANRQLALSVVFLASCADAYEQLGNESVKKLKELIGGQEYIDKYNVSTAPEIDLSSRYKSDDQSDTDTVPVDETPVTTGTPKTTTTGTPSTGGRYTYSVGDGGTSSGGVYSTPIDSATDTTSSLTDLSTTDMTGKEIEIPDTVKQGAYTVTGYDYWIKSGKEMTWAEGTNQRKVSEIWKQQGSVFKNGIAVINVDGVDRYLVAVTTKFGEAGDCIDVTLEDGTVIPCIIGDSKGSDAGSEWGHVLDGGSINVLEFEVQRAKYLQSGNPTTAKWDLPWDSSKSVKKIKNTGSIIGAKTTDKTVQKETSGTITSNTDTSPSDSSTSDSGTVSA